MTRPTPSAPARILIWIGGATALVLGTIGIFLPGLPTTPFVLLAAACFVRASPRTHAWLLRNRTFGPLLREWETHHSLPRRIKRIALLTMTLTVFASVLYFTGQPWLQASIILAAAVGCFFITRIPSRD